MNESAINAEAARLRRRIEKMISAEQGRKHDIHDIRRDRNENAATQMMGFASTPPLATFGAPNGSTTVGP